MRFRLRQDLRVESFEYVEVGEGLALVRLAGEWRTGPPAVFRVLAGTEELSPLPEPPGDGDGLWRAAFSAQTELIQPGTRFMLEADDGRVVELPVPVERGVGAAVEPAPTPEPEPEPEPEPDALVLPGSLSVPESDELPPEPAVPEDEFRAVDEERRRLQRALNTERARHERAEASLREQLRVMVAETADFMGRLEGYEMRRAELEKELSWERLLHKETRRVKEETEAERDDALRRLGPVEAELTEARHELDLAGRASRQLVQARERNTELERRLEQQEALLRNAREVLDRGMARLIEIEERLVELRDEAAAEPDEPAEPVLVPQHAKAVEEALEDVERGSERLALLERRIGELREGIATQPKPRVAERPGLRRFLR